MLLFMRHLLGLPAAFACSPYQDSWRKEEGGHLCLTLSFLHALTFCLCLLPACTSGEAWGGEAGWRRRLPLPVPGLRTGMEPASTQLAGGEEEALAMQEASYLPAC